MRDPYFITHRVDERCIYLIDRCNDSPMAPSITNAAETVIEILTKRYGAEFVDARVVAYMDTDSWIDQLLTKNGRFAGFSPIRVTTEGEFMMWLDKRVGRSVDAD